MKILKKIYIYLFIFALFGPTLFFFIAKDYIDTNNYQNRELHEFPNIGNTSFAQWSTGFEDYFNDHLPFKNQLTRINTYIDIEIFHNVDSDTVLLGKNDWLFYKKDNCISDYRGVIPVTDAELKKIKEQLLRAKEYFNSQGIEFVVFFAPNKAEIYGQYLPSYIKVVDPVSRVDKIAAYIEEELDIKVIYPKEQLINQSQEVQVYKKYDTHWNRVGAFIAAQELLNSLGKKSKNINDFAIVKEGEIGGDLANMLGAAKFYNDDDINILDRDQEDVTLLKDVPQQNLNYREYTSKKGEGTILILGDSFTTAMMPYVAEQYKSSVQVHLNNYEKGMIEQIKPDVVVCERVERVATDIAPLMERIMDVELE